MTSFPSQPPDTRPENNQFAKEVWEFLGCKDHLTKKFIQVCLIAIKVFDTKQQMYGVSNIQRAGADGVRIRLGDKISRLDHLMPQQTEPVEEGIADTFGDIGNYGLIGLMCRWGWWPKKEEVVKLSANPYGELCPTIVGEDESVVQCRLPPVLVSRGIPSMATCADGHTWDRRNSIPTERTAA